MASAKRTPLTCASPCLMRAAGAGEHSPDTAAAQPWGVYRLRRVVPKLFDLVAGKNIPGPQTWGKLGPRSMYRSLNCLCARRPHRRGSAIQRGTTLAVSYRSQRPDFSLLEFGASGYDCSGTRSRPANGARADARSPCSGISLARGISLIERR